MGRLVVPYIRLSIPGLATLLGFVGLVELASFLTIGEAQGKTLVLFGNKIDVHEVMPWAVAVGLLVLGGAWLRFEVKSFALVWDDVTADLKQRSV